MKWKYTSNFVTKDNLAFLDILAHNNWKRPIMLYHYCRQENMMGLQPYLYKEGFTYHLIPFKPDTASRDQLGKTNTLVMYDNIMNKFKWVITKPLNILILNQPRCFTRLYYRQ